MFHSYFSRFASVIALAVCVSSAYGAPWRDCKKAKIRELDLQYGADSHGGTKRRHNRRASDRRERIEAIDTWLWKNCRVFSYELRKLEQQRM